MSRGIISFILGFDEKLRVVKNMIGPKVHDLMDDKGSQSSLSARLFLSVTCPFFLGVGRTPARMRDL